MKKHIILLTTILSLVAFLAHAQTTDIVILNTLERARLKALMTKNIQAKQLHDSLVQEANRYLADKPQPLKQIFYEGLLPTNPDRIETQKSLADINKTVAFIYAYYGSIQPVYARQAKAMVLAWATTYQPTANPINENKLVPLFWAYHLFKTHFTDQEKGQVEAWMQQIAQGQMARLSTPNNNWEAKRQKIIGTVGCILGNKAMQDFAVKGFKAYINTAYFADGTSNDLIERDALHYHVSGLEPTIGVFVTLTPFYAGFNLFNYSAPSGASIRKSVEYTLPYAQGKIKRLEWINTKVALDKKRAAAGLAEYQPGKFFDPRAALPMFAWAGYYNPDWYSLFGQASATQNYLATWVGLLNSP